ncbi:MAG: response regulator transcription factor [Acidobacteria bacterium]|nr:response regulator transcription factor [Acidobacteriota bacterium]
MANEIQILIADDYPIVRRGLRQIIDDDPNLRVVAEAGDGQEALEKIRQLKPHVAVLDIDMPGPDGFGVAQTIREEGLAVAVIFLTVHREESFMDKAFKVGACGYILKDSALADIVAGIRTVIAGQPYVSPAMITYLINHRRPPERGQGLASLTPTERTILKMIAEYKTTKDIAESLFISPRTVETHRTNICQRLNLRGSHALMKFALAHRTELDLYL